MSLQQRIKDSRATPAVKERLSVPPLGFYLLGHADCRDQAAELAAPVDALVEQMAAALNLLMASENRGRVMPIGDGWDAARAALAAHAEVYGK